MIAGKRPNDDPYGRVEAKTALANGSGEGSGKGGNASTTEGTTTGTEGDDN